MRYLALILCTVLVLAGCKEHDSELIRKPEAHGEVIKRFKGKHPYLKVDRDGVPGVIKVFVTYRTYGRCSVKEHYPECSK